MLRKVRLGKKKKKSGATRLIGKLIWLLITSLRCEHNITAPTRQDLMTLFSDIGSEKCRGVGCYVYQAAGDELFFNEIQGMTSPQPAHDSQVMCYITSSLLIIAFPLWLSSNFCKRLLSQHPRRNSLGYRMYRMDHNHTYP